MHFKIHLFFLSNTPNPDAVLATVTSHSQFSSQLVDLCYRDNLPTHSIVNLYEGERPVRE